MIPFRWAGPPVSGDLGMLTLCGRLSYPLVWDFTLTAGSLSRLLGDLRIEQAWDLGPSTWQICGAMAPGPACGA